MTVLNGENVDIHVYPFVVQIIGGNGIFQCPGSLITFAHVLTIINCVDLSSKVKIYRPQFEDSFHGIEKISRIRTTTSNISDFDLAVVKVKNNEKL